MGATAADLSLRPINSNRFAHDADSVARQTPVAKPLILRNSRIFIGVLLITALIGFAGVPCFGVLALMSVFPVRGFGFDRMVSGLSSAAAAFFSGSLGLFLWRQALRMARNEVRLVAEGVYFRVDARRQTPEIFFAWGEIQAITHKRNSNNVHVCCVIGADEQALSFTSFTFFRAKRIARNIAAHAGKSMRED